MKTTKLSVHFPLLTAVAKIKNKKAQALVLRHLSKDKAFVSTLREVAKNVIAGNLKLSARDKRLLNRHTRIIRALAKRKNVAQSGGFIQAVLPFLASALGDILLS